jgi:hypothetical protein
MNQNIKLAKYLIGIGTKQMIGVLGSGDSFEIVESFIHEGGQFLESPTEFSAPIIASAMNKLDQNQNRSVSISIRGPGLVSSLPGLYHNYIEDLRSLSISEGLSSDDSNYNYHKEFNAENALSSAGLVRDNRVDISQNSNVILPLKFDDKSRMLHLITRSNQQYLYNQSSAEICSDQSNRIELKNRKKIFVFGKRGIEYLAENGHLIPDVPYFLTPAALPYADLNSPNFLGVWTGNEQFKAYFLESKFLSESIIVRMGVMKRELLTLRISLQHFDVPIHPDYTNIGLLDFLKEFGSTEVEGEKNYLVNFRKKVANIKDTWNVYTVITIINNLHMDLNYSFDVGSYATIIENYIKPTKVRRLHSAFIGKFMGTAVPISIGVSLAEPHIPVLCMLGEGSFASSFNEIASIVNLQLPVCIIVFSDGSMHSIVSSKKIDDQIKNKFMPSNYYALEKIKIPNLPTHYINSVKQFTSALSKWDMKSPAMMFLKFDPSTYAKGVELLR